MARSWLALGALGMASLSLGCVRGCDCMGGRDPAGAHGPSEGADPSVGLGPHALAGTDCSDGLMRCVEGRIEASRLAHIPSPCVPQEKPGACSCPWVTVEECPGGCAAEGLEIVASEDGGARQLCEGHDVRARLPLPTEPAIGAVCGDESVVCVDGVIRACRQAGLPAQVLGICLHGCAPGVGLPPGEALPVRWLTGSGAGAILCLPDQTERR